MTLSADAVMTALISLGSLFAVSVPLLRGMRIVFQARVVTRRVEPAELERAVAGGAAVPGEALAIVMARVLAKSLKDRDSGAYPEEFVEDATRQYVLNEYDSHFARLISMYANLLPPIGFIGTTGGLLILFLSMHLADASLELGALAVALTSSVFALIGFAGLEAMKIRLYGRLLVALDDVMSIQRGAGESIPDPVVVETGTSSACHPAAVSLFTAAAASAIDSKPT